MSLFTEKNCMLSRIQTQPPFQVLSFLFVDRKKAVLDCFNSNVPSDNVGLAVNVRNKVNKSLHSGSFMCVGAQEKQIHPNKLL